MEGTEDEAAAQRGPCACSPCKAPALARLALDAPFAVVNMAVDGARKEHQKEKTVARHKPSGSVTAVCAATP